ncbi:putative uncharacterized protein [Clostridium sp. CAG:1000]|nr:putative uncharacterized protein [Clostridium sp. CAG:1000]
MKDVKKDKIEIDDDYIEDDDRRVIVFVALALLIIIATVIGLLVSHQKNEINKDVKEPHRDYIVPELEVDDENKIVNNVVTPVSIIINNEGDNQENNINETYEITYHYYGKTHVIKVNDTVEKYVPLGYSSCKYYIDENNSIEYDFNEKVSSSKDIYMSCEEKVYTIKYSHLSNNKPEYKLSDGIVPLIDAETDLIFNGWYTDKEYINKVTSLSEELLKYSNDEIINLYASFIPYYTVNYYNNSGEIIDSAKVTKEQLNDYKLLDGSNLSYENNKFLGWSTKKNSMKIDYFNNDSIDISSDINLYAVFGSSIIIFTDNDKAIEARAITKEEADNFDLPTKEDLGLEVPTYFIPVDSISDKTKTIVPDDTETLFENEVKLSDVISSSLEDYNPKVGDKVEEIEKELNWSIDKKITDPITGEETVEKITDENEVKEIIKDNNDNGIDTKLNTEWTEQSIGENI